MTFWIVAGALAMGVGAVLILALTGRRREIRAASSATSDIRVYRDQLAEIERDLARGVLTEDEANQVKVEVSRRLLEADRLAQSEKTDTPEAPRGLTRLAAGGVLAVVVAGTAGLYSQIGAPGYPDLPLADRLAAAEDARANRPSQAAAEAELAGRIPPALPADPRYLELIDQLRATLQDRPNDIQGHVLLARNEAALGNFAAARAAQERVILLKGDTVTGADYADLADLMILGAGGYVSPEAENALLEALRQDQTNGTALYYSGLLYAQIGRPDRAFAVWRQLLDQSGGSEPWVAPIRAQIEDVAQLAGERYELPPLPAAPALAPERGPTREQIEAAQNMSDEDRAAMIEGMVEGLAARLAEEGGPVEDWARLITALGVLGRTDQARAIADEADASFAADPGAASILAEARARAGIAE